MKRFFITGFSSWSDLLNTLYKVKSVAINTGTFTLINLISVAGFIYNPHQLVFLLITLMLMDWATGLYKSVKFGNFSTYKAQRMFWNIFFTMFLIGTSTMLAAHMWVFAALKIADVMMTGFLITYFVSIFENLHEIDKRIIPDKFFFAMKRILDLDKVLDRYFKDDGTKAELAEGVDEIVKSESDKPARTDDDEPKPSVEPG